MDSNNNEIILYTNNDSESSVNKRLDEYQRLYKMSVEDTDGFWSEIAQRFYWKSFPNKPFNSYNFDVTKGPVFANWFEDGITNMCYNVLDRIVDRGEGDVIAFHWEGNDGNTRSHITYKELKQKVCKFANAMKTIGIKKGDKIAIYMSVSIEAVVAMLACARIGAIHTVVFAGFSAQALAGRLIDSNCVLLITSDIAFRADKEIYLKQISDCALKICQKKNHKIIARIVKQNSIEINTKALDLNIKEYFWDDIIEKASDVCEVVWLNSEDTLFILYTSGSTGTPKGVVHTIGGYLLHSYLSFKYICDFSEGNVFFSTSDVGWMGAHTLSVYGGMANGATTVLLEGTPFYPNPYRIWEIIERLEVNIFYTAPTAVRTIMKFGIKYLKTYKRDSLKVLAIAGEPIDYKAWMWYWYNVGNSRCAIIDSYGQTETGGIMITALPGCTPLKPGSAAFPFFGVVPAIVDDNGRELEGPAAGHLVFKKPWPGIARTIVGKQELFEMNYFNQFHGYYWTGDGVKRDRDGYYWITGRMDEMINVSGRLLSLLEIESAIVEHRAISEAKVVPKSHTIKGQCLYVFVILNNGFVFNRELDIEIRNRVRVKIGGLAEPDVVRPVNAFPMTKSGKIMRKILRKISQNDFEFGDTSTMSDDRVLLELTKVH